MSSANYFTEEHILVAKALVVYAYIKKGAALQNQCRKLQVSFWWPLHKCPHYTRYILQSRETRHKKDHSLLASHCSIVNSLMLKDGERMPRTVAFLPTLTQMPPFELLLLPVRTNLVTRDAARTQLGWKKKCLRCKCCQQRILIGKDRDSRHRRTTLVGSSALCCAPPRRA